MVGRRLRFLGLVVTVGAAIGLALPAGASATSTYYDITLPADGSVVNTIPSTPSVTFIANHGWQAAPDCDYTGPGLATSPQPCNGAHEKPAANGVFSLTVSGSVVQITPPVVVGPSETETISFEYDTTVPSLSVDSPAYGAELPSAQPSFAFTASDDATGSLSTTCKIDSGSAAPCTSPFTPGTPLGQGGHNLQVVASDGANSTTVNHTFIVDTVAPVISVIFPTPGVTVDSSVPEVNLSIEGATAGSFCRFDYQTYQACGASWLGGSLADGAHTLWVKGVDVAGNVTEISVAFFVDDALGSTPLPFETSITGSKGGKVKRGKFKARYGFSLLGPQGADPAVICAARVTITLKPKGGRTYKKRVKLRRSGERCRLSTSFTLPKRFKGKRAKLVFRYPGTTALGPLSRAKTISKL